MMLNEQIQKKKKEKEKEVHQKSIIYVQWLIYFRLQPISFVINFDYDPE